MKGVITFVMVLCVALVFGSYSMALAQKSSSEFDLKRRCDL